MKKALLIFFLLSQPICSELILEITKGSDDPYSIAIINFDGPKNINNEISSIVSNDLNRTGEFRILKDNKLLSSPKNQDEINYDDFKLLNVDFIVMGATFEEDKSNISVAYEIYSVNKKSKIRTSTVHGIPNRLRQLSHYISDGIYEEVTGIKGVASTRLLYVTEQIIDTKSLFKLVVADADGENEQVLLRSREPIISPSWSPNGKFLSLTLYQDGNAEIYILNLKNKNLTRLTNHYSIDTESSWSSNGSKIMFTSGRSGSPQLYEINLRKSNTKPKRITFEGNYNAKGSYLPNGEGIIFVHRKDSSFQIALKYFNENFVRALTKSRLDESPSISPNGNVIIYAISEDGTGILAGLTLSGARFKLPTRIGQVREPSWSGFLR